MGLVRNLIKSDVACIIVILMFIYITLEKLTLPVWSTLKRQKNNQRILILIIMLKLQVESSVTANHETVLSNFCQ